jgi:HprK-related kinase A
MRRLGDLAEEEFSNALSGVGVGLRLGPFNANIKCDIAEIHEPLARFYADYPWLPNDSVFSFHVGIKSVKAIRGLLRRKVRFLVDGRTPHEDMPLSQALPILEWGINLVTAFRAHSFLMLHSAVIERRGFAMLLPAAPGFGKSTLCAGLSQRGWRTFSDEFALIRPGSHEMLPVPRPIALKNESVEVIRQFAPDAYVGPISYGTRKGDVAHIKPTADSIFRQSESAPANLIVFPRWTHDSGTKLEPLSRAEGFMLLATNAFNYDLLGEPAFLTVKDFISTARCFRLTYSDLEDATTILAQLQDSVIDKV